MVLAVTGMGIRMQTMDMAVMDMVTDMEATVMGMDTMEIPRKKTNH